MINSEKEISTDKFLENMNELFLPWNYFTDFEDISQLDKYTVEIEELNKLLGLDELKIDEELIKIVKKHPKVIDVLLIMISLSEDKLKKLPIYSPYNYDHKMDKLTQIKTIEEETLYFFDKTNLKQLFVENRIKNIWGYLFHAVGINTDRRKNKSGKYMELECDKYIKDFCELNNLKYKKQCILKVEGLSKRVDFLIYLKDKTIVIEVNNYFSHGSKIKAISKEYIQLEKDIAKEDKIFIWVTNGDGWKKERNIICQNLDKLNHFINLKQLKEGYLNKFL